MSLSFYRKDIFKLFGMDNVEWKFWIKCPRTSINITNAGLKKLYTKGFFFVTKDHVTAHAFIKNATFIYHTISNNLLLKTPSQEFTVHKRFTIFIPSRRSMEFLQKNTRQLNVEFIVKNVIDHTLNSKTCLS